MQSVALRGRDGGATAELGDDLATCLRASTGGGDKPHVLAPIAFDSRQNCVTSTEVFGSLGSSTPQAQAIAFSCKDYGADATADLAPTMRAMNHANSHQNGGGQLAVAMTYRDATGMEHWPDTPVCVTGDITHTLKAEGFDASEDGTGRGQPIVATAGAMCAHVYSGGMGGRVDMAAQGYVQPIGMAVRRLLPVECEALQGFPREYTDIPFRVKPAADGPRYKALGNSWAVPVVRRLGARINVQLRMGVLA